MPGIIVVSARLLYKFIVSLYFATRTTGLEILLLLQKKRVASHWL